MAGPTLNRLLKDENILREIEDKGFFEDSKVIFDILGWKIRNRVLHERLFKN